MTDEKLFMENLWKRRAGVPESAEIKRIPNTDLNAIRKSEWSSEFEELMRNRLLMGYFRYGRIRDGKGNTAAHIRSIERRLKKYEETGNKEFLVDIANICMVEFMQDCHPDSHFSAIDDGEHIEKTSGTDLGTEYIPKKL